MVAASTGGVGTSKAVTLSGQGFRTGSHPEPGELPEPKDEGNLALPCKQRNRERRPQVAC